MYIRILIVNGHQSFQDCVVMFGSPQPPWKRLLFFASSERRFFKT